MTRKIYTITASTVLLAALSAPAFAGDMPADFAAIDANADGQVTYKEYAKAATGMTRTAAAQQFIKISNGQQIFTEGDLLTAIALKDTPNWGQTNYVGAVDYGQTTQPYTVTQPNTQVLSSGATGGIIYGGETTVTQPENTYTSETTSGAYSNTETPVISQPVPEYSSETTSGAYTVTEPSADYTDTVTEEYVAPEPADTKAWSETGESGAAAPTPDPIAEPDINIESPAGIVLEPREVSPLDSVEETVDETMSDAKDMATDVMEETEDAVTPDE